MQHACFYYSKISSRSGGSRFLPEGMDSLPPFVRDEPFIRKSFVHEDASIRVPELARDDILQPSLGALDRLPHELWNMILAQMDPLSICQFMVASSGAKAAVERFRPFQNLVKHAAPVLVTLGKMRLAKVHTIEAIHTVLTSPDCVACGQLGPFICLPTCERACVDCLDRNIRFWVLTPTAARRIYCLKVKDVERLPTMWTVPTPMRGPLLREEMVSERHAAQLALDLHGADEDPQLNGRSWAAVAEGNELLGWYQGDKGIAPDRRAPRSMTWGLGFMRMPYLGAGVPVEHMYWCEGCMAHTYRTSYELGKIYFDAKSLYTDFGQQNGSARDVELRHRSAFTAWPMAKLLEHIPVCPGISWLKKQMLLE